MKLIFEEYLQAVHDGINCKQYQDQLNNDKDSESAQQTKQLLQDLIDKEEALNCPTCHVSLGSKHKFNISPIFHSTDFSAQEMGL